MYLWDVERLGKYFPSAGKSQTAYDTLVGEQECILASIRRRPGRSPATSAYLRAGPRARLHFDPARVHAAIVTCGGLCPGLNNVVREITRALFHLYGIEGKVHGIVGGYKGFYDPATPPLDLTVRAVEDIHHAGGTVLGSSRGGFDIDKICDFLRAKEISQLYVIGGDGTHRGAFHIHEACMERVGRVVAV